MKIERGDRIIVSKEEGYLPSAEAIEATISDIKVDIHGVSIYHATSSEGGTFALTPRGGSAFVYHHQPSGTVDSRSGHGFVHVTKKNLR